MNSATVLPMQRHISLAGIGCGIGAGALWGLVFLAPELAASFSPLELTIGRYFSYGLVSTLLIAPNWPRICPLISRKEWRTLVRLALLGNALYYILLATAVQMGGIAMTSLVIGFLPVAVTIIGSRDKDAVALSKLIPSLLLCAAGAICIGSQALMSPGGNTVMTKAIGLLCAVGALASWTTFAVGNSRALARLHHISAHDWNLLTGVMTGAQTLLLLPVALVISSGSHSAHDWSVFTSICLGLALLASIAGNALWNRMSRLLPLTLVGQMILFETLFALIYGFIWEQRLPTMLETIAFVLVVLSVISCIHAHRKPRAAIDLALTHQ